ncbi:hypothetical protein ETAA8_25900 [Anatilimnocola aggregata]|uniref:Uncharacterized protein n=1 Tax=Anatilimnocola aggregata TaxID=2528021 RepID=A0A517YBK7_9BACT|nr:hypothetical protein ETAA8_25900 [Anatilimnocola aggregata]
MPACMAKVLPSPWPNESLTTQYFWQPRFIPFGLALRYIAAMSRLAQRIPIRLLIRGN